MRLSKPFTDANGWCYLAIEDGQATEIVSKFRGVEVEFMGFTSHQNSYGPQFRHPALNLDQSDLSDAGVLNALSTYTRLIGSISPVHCRGSGVRGWIKFKGRAAIMRALDESLYLAFRLSARVAGLFTNDDACRPARSPLRIPKVSLCCYLSYEAERVFLGRSHAPCISWSRLLVRGTDSI